MNKTHLKLLIVALLFAFARIAAAQTTTFTYQGRLTDASAQANGTYDLSFALHDAETGGAPLTRAAVNAAVNTGSGNSLVGKSAGELNTTGNLKSFFGRRAGAGNRTGGNNPVIGQNADVGANDLNFAAAIGSGAVVAASNMVVLGRTGDTVRVPGAMVASGNINADGDVMIAERKNLYLSQGSNNRIYYNSTINSIEFRAGDSYLWFNARNNRTNMVLDSEGDLGIVGNYEQFSDARYKTDVQTFAGALDAVRRLRGVTFNWNPELNKDSKTQIGFIAQEVEAVLPNLVSTDKDGYKSVSYPNALPVLVEAVKEQQTEIERQNRQIERQQKQIDELKRIVCVLKSEAEICLEEK